MLVIVTPVKNEGQRLLDVANQLKSQTLMPDFWIIVDDNSTDETPQLIKKLKEDNDFILSITLNEPSDYDQVSRYGQVLQFGFKYALDCFKHIKFLGVLDSDIKLKKDYYETIINCYSNFPQLGAASGLYVVSENNDSYSDSKNIQNLAVCGGAIIFRKECFFDIGGFPTCARPDTVALLKAANRGWKIGIASCTYAIHLRPNKSLTKFIKLGFGSHSLGYTFINALLSGPYSALRNLSLSQLGFTIGYILGIIYGVQIEDEEIKSYFKSSFHRAVYKFLYLRSKKSVNTDIIKGSIFLI